MKLTHEKIKKKFSYITSVKTNTIKSGGMGLHWHSNIEICTVIEGNCEFNVNGCLYKAGEGDVIFVNSGEIHSINIRMGKIGICTFNPSLLHSIYGNIGVILTHVKFECIKELGIENEVKSCFDYLRNEINSNEKYSSIIFQANLIKLCGLLLRYFEDDNVNKNDVSKLITLQKILEYISENFSDNITLELIADTFNYNPAYVSRLLKNRTGVNFKYYLDNIRCQKAMEMLMKTHMSISEIAFACGYNNIRTFNNVFKKIVAVTPSYIRSKK